MEGKRYQFSFQKEETSKIEYYLHFKQLGEKKRILDLSEEFSINEIYNFLEIPQNHQETFMEFLLCVYDDTKDCFENDLDNSNQSIEFDD